MQDHTRDLARGLVRADHEVVVITSRHPDGALEEIVDGVRYVFVDAPRHQNHPPGCGSLTARSFGFMPSARSIYSTASHRVR